MSIKVGQIRKISSGHPYLTEIPFTITDYDIAGIGNKVFKDFAIKATNKFQLNTTYYIRIKIQRLDINENMGTTIEAGDNDPHNLNLDIRLYTNETEGNGYQTISEPILIEPYSSGNSSSDLEQEKAFIDWCNACKTDNSPAITSDASIYLDALIESYNDKQVNINTVTNYASTADQTIELVFTPYKEAEYLVFQLRRVAYDYNTEARSISLYEDEEGSTTVEVYSVNNILTQIANKIGIQSRPGTLVIINKEPMRIGKSGTLEINNGIFINSVGFAAPNENINDFILDYTYNA